MFVLEDESGKTSTTRFLAGKVGLSAGWRGFSIAHELKEGDVLVFHMVEARKFKVIPLAFLLGFASFSCIARGFRISLMSQSIAVCLCFEGLHCENRQFRSS